MSTTKAQTSDSVTIKIPARLLSTLYSIVADEADFVCSADFEDQRKKGDEDDTRYQNEVIDLYRLIANS